MNKDSECSGTARGSQRKPKKVEEFKVKSPAEIKIKLEIRN